MNKKINQTKEEKDKMIDTQGSEAYKNIETDLKRGTSSPKLKNSMKSSNLSRDSKKKGSYMSQFEQRLSHLNDSKKNSR